MVSDYHEAEKRILESKSIDELVRVYDLFPQHRKELFDQFKKRKSHLQSTQKQYSTKLKDNGTNDD